MDQATTTKQIPGGGVHLSLGGERHGGVGEGEETTRVNLGRGSPSDLPPSIDYCVIILMPLISAFVRHE
jgi:hypothetical protein